MQLVSRELRLLTATSCTAASHLFLLAPAICSHLGLLLLLLVALVGKAEEEVAGARTLSLKFARLVNATDFPTPASAFSTPSPASPSEEAFLSAVTSPPYKCTPAGFA